MGGIFAPKPAAGPHKSRECLPLSIILRNRLKFALTRKESLMIVMQKSIKVDGKVRTELNFPAGFQDVISIEGSDDCYRLLYDTKGRFVLHKVSKEEGAFKLARVVSRTAAVAEFRDVGVTEGQPSTRRVVLVPAVLCSHVCPSPGLPFPPFR